MKTLLLIIDPQIDFVDKNGTLPVSGASADMRRLADFIDRQGAEIDRILITLDSHRIVHIATPIYWEDELGNSPAPYSVITLQDITSGKWRAKYHAEDAPVYLERLEAQGKNLIIWPPHCIFGSTGWAIYPELYDSVYNWACNIGGHVETHIKGQDEKTEMFSAVRPDVSLEPEKDENLAANFIAMLDGYERILVAGEAEDFCVKETIKDIIQLRPDLSERLTLLTDCTSAIYPDSPELLAFWENLREKGMHFAASTEIL